jgi:hypothetical protein
LSGEYWDTLTCACGYRFFVTPEGRTLAAEPDGAEPADAAAVRQQQAEVLAERARRASIPADIRLAALKQEFERLLIDARVSLAMAHLRLELEAWERAAFRQEEEGAG